MDQSTLVTDSLTILRLLADEKVRVRASALTYTNDRGWRFMLAPELFTGERDFYLKLAEIIEPADPRLSQIELSDIEVIAPTSDFVEDLPRLMTGRVRSYDDVRVGRNFYHHVIALPNQPPIAGDPHPLRS